MSARTAKFSCAARIFFPGYWQRPAETAKALEGGWFHTGDQGEVDANGNWRVTGTAEKSDRAEFGPQLRRPNRWSRSSPNRLPEAQQVVLVGNQRSFLALLIATAVRRMAFVR